MNNQKPATPQQSQAVEEKIPDKLTPSKSPLAPSNLIFTKKDPYVTIAIHMIKSLRLSDQKIFKYLKAELEAFNQEIQKALSDKKSIENYPWKHSLYTTLKNFLVEAVATEDSRLRDRFLSKIKKWYDNKIEKKLKNPDPNSSQAYPSTRDNSDIDRLSPIKALDSNASFMNNSMNQSNIIDNSNLKLSFVEKDSNLLPSKALKKELKDYEEGRRTLHSQAYPPCEQ